MDVVTSLTSSAAPSDKSAQCVIVYPTTPDTMVATGCAAARAFPIFSRKSQSTKKHQTGPRVEISLLDCATPETPIDQLENLHQLISSATSSIREAACMGDTPADIMNPDMFVRKAENIAAELDAQGLSVEMNVLRMDLLKEGGFGGIVGVGQGAAAAGREPALIHLTHTFGDGTETDAPKWAIVGKGIVFDTGGLHIKSRQGMNGMKVDMLGAAACLYAFKTAVEARAMASGRLDALLCVAENSVSAWSIRPDDILTMHSGRTVEINNTDAEGRLVLGDGVSYAGKVLESDVILTMATLTGAQGIATGKRHCAVMATSAELEAGVIASGKRSGDLAFPVLYAPELLKKELSSKVADMVNSVKDRANAQVSCAGQFIANHLPDKFVDNGREFVHCDMAAPACIDGRSTGYGVALVVDLLSTYKPGKAQNGNARASV